MKIITSAQPPQDLAITATPGVIGFDSNSKLVVVPGTPFTKPTALPELPNEAALTAQDIATALVTLGLVTQAAAP